MGVLPPDISAPEILIETPSVTIGEAMSFTITLNSNSAETQKLLIDYVVHHQKANGTLAPKVFKWAQLTAQPNQRIELRRQHAIRPITTRKYNSGEHALSPRINRVDYGQSFFELTVPD